MQKTNRDLSLIRMVNMKFVSAIVNLLQKVTTWLLDVQYRHLENLGFKLGFKTQELPDIKDSVDTINEDDMYMCIGITGNTMNLYGVIARTGEELAESIKSLDASLKVIYVGNVSSIKKAILHDDQIQKQVKYYDKIAEKAKWN